MNINIENYEIWFLDYAEGNLDESQKQELYAFLQIHPRLKEELDEFKIFEVIQKTTKFPGKQQLKKSKAFKADDFIAYHEGDLNSNEKKEIEEFIAANASAEKEFDQLSKMYLQSEENITFGDKTALKSENIGLGVDQFIAFHEGDLNAIEQKKLLAFLKNDAVAKKEFDQLGQLYLTADSDIVYADKEKLKKKGAIIIPLFYRYAAVAASLLLLISLFFLQDQQTYNPRGDYAENSFDIFESNDNGIDEDSLNLPYRMTNPMYVASEENQLAIETKQPERDHNDPTANSFKGEGKPNNNFAQETIINSGVSQIPALKSIAIKKLDGYSLASSSYSKLDGRLDIASYDISIKDPIASTNTTINVLEKTKPLEAITLLAFVEEKAAQAVTGKKNNKLRLFDVIKKVGDKSNLYDLSEKDDNKFSLKVLNVEMEGKRKKIAL